LADLRRFKLAQPEEGVPRKEITITILFYQIITIHQRFISFVRLLGKKIFKPQRHFEIYAPPLTIETPLTSSATVELTDFHEQNNNTLDREYPYP
jgi:hypothetical protein